MKIVLASGGSGGHLIPALKVAEELTQQGHETIFMGSVGKHGDLITQKGFFCEDIPSRGLQRNTIPELVKTALSLMRAGRQARQSLRKIQPDAVVGFGGYGAFPVVITAFFLGIPTMIHEQNVLPGKANALLSKFVRKIAVNFPQSVQYFSARSARKTVLTGCPCHTVGHEDDKDKILDHFHLKKDKVTILVMGGSQGSQRINQVFAATVQRLNNSLDMQIIHLCGRRDYAMLQSFYASLNIPYALFEFLNKMEWAYTAADVIIARAGAATVTELYLLEKPAILIPYPYAGGHQKYNAQVLVDLNRAKVIEEKDLNDVALEKAIVYFVQGKHSSKTAVPGTELSLYRDAAKRLAQEMLSLIS